MSTPPSPVTKPAADPGKVVTPEAQREAEKLVQRLFSNLTVTAPAL